MHTESLAAPVAATNPVPSRLESWLEWIAYGAAASIVLSIAVSQILLGIGIAVLLISRRRLAFPPILLPLSLFFAWTVVSELLSGDIVRGLPQIRKFFVFGILLLVFNGFRGVSSIRNLIWAWTAGSTLSAVFAIDQFFARWHEAIAIHAQRYDYVLDGRIKGLAGHWMTFGGEGMIALLALLALLLFSRSIKPAAQAAGWLCAVILWTALVMGYTRSIFLLGVPVGALVLAWNRNRWLTLAVPAVALVTFAAAPPNVRERVLSAMHPHGDVDSNSRRSIMRRAGARMILAHPWFGLGPEQIAPQFNAYVPPDVPRPLPKGWYGHLHNIYFQYAAERGLPALGFLLWMIGKMALDFYRALRSAADCRFVLCSALAVIAAVLAEGFFEHNLGDSEILTMFLVMSTCGYVAIRRANASVRRDAFV